MVSSNLGFRFDFHWLWFANSSISWFPFPKFSTGNKFDVDVQKFFKILMIFTRYFRKYICFNRYVIYSHRKKQDKKGIYTWKKNSDLALKTLPWHFKHVKKTKNIEYSSETTAVTICAPICNLNFNFGATAEGVLIFWRPTDWVVGCCGCLWSCGSANEPFPNTFVRWLGADADERLNLNLLPRLDELPLGKADRVQAARKSFGTRRKKRNSFHISLFHTKIIRMRYVSVSINKEII